MPICKAAGLHDACIVDMLTLSATTPAALTARAQSVAAFRASASVCAVTVSLCQASATTGVMVPTAAADGGTASVMAPPAAAVVSLC